MKTKLVKSKILLQDARKPYVVVLNDDYWDFWDPRVTFYLDTIVDNPTSIGDIVPVGPDEKVDSFTFYKFYVGLN